MKVVYAPEAVADLIGLLRYLRERSPIAAERLRNRVDDRLARLAAGELEGPEVTLRSGRKVRSWPVPPVRVYYQRRSDVFVVLRVYHQKRRPIERIRRR